MVQAAFQMGHEALCAHHRCKCIEGGLCEGPSVPRPMSNSLAIKHAGRTRLPWSRIVLTRPVPVLSRSRVGCICMCRLALHGMWRLIPFPMHAMPWAGSPSPRFCKALQHSTALTEVQFCTCYLWQTADDVVGPSNGQALLAQASPGIDIRLNR